VSALRGGFLLACLLWLVIVVVGLSLRPLMTVDETRYLSVAWEMWSRGDFLVPYRNGEPYHHKPPLLFWLIQLGWAVGGVSEIWGRLVAPLFALACLPAAAVLARRLFPERSVTVELAPLAVCAGGLFLLNASLTMFDAMVTFWSLVGWIGIVTAWRLNARRGWIIVALAIGLGILSKGPVILLHMAPVALLAPLWMGSENRPAWRRWYAGFGLAVLGGAAIALLWAVPAAVSGGEDFARKIFLGQHTGRMVESFAHRRPLWWYLPVIVIGLMPLLAWLAPWRLLRATPGLWRDRGLLFILTACLPVIAAFSAISGKQPHYILPELALLAMLVARIADQAAFTDRRLDRILPALVSIVVGAIVILFPWLGFARLAEGRADIVLHTEQIIAMVTLGIALVAYGVWLIRDSARDVRTRLSTVAISGAGALVGIHMIFASFAIAYDTQRVARLLTEIERDGRPIAWNGDYEGDFHFTGRLLRPITDLNGADPVQWAREHPGGVVLVTYRRRNVLPAEWPRPLQLTSYRGRILAIWPAALLEARGAELLTDPG